MKGPRITDSGTTTAPIFLESSNGIVRGMFFNGSTVGVADGLIFRGAQGVDWVDRHIAPTDNRTVTILSDKKRTFNSGAGSYARVEKQWVPFNKSLVYNDDESGSSEISSNFSTQGKQGMGDVYVYDVFTPTPALGTGTLLWTAQASLYWHER